MGISKPVVIEKLRLDDLIEFVGRWIFECG